MKSNTSSNNCWLGAGVSDMGNVVPEVQWRKVETAPKDGTDVLLFLPAFVVAVGYWSSDLERWITHIDVAPCPYCGNKLEPKYWLPLPNKFEE